MTSNYATFVMMLPYCTSEFNSSASTAGLITGILVIAALIGRFFSGKFVWSFGFLKLLTAGTVIYAIATACYPLVGSQELLFIDRMIAGLAYGIVGTGTGTLAAFVTPVKYQGRGISYFSMGTALALCIGPFMAISLQSLFGFKFTFWVATFFSFCCFISIPFVKVTQKDDQREDKKIALTDFIEPSIIPFCLVVLLICFTWGNMQAYISAYAEANNVKAAAALFFVVYALSMLIYRPFTGKIYDLRGPKVVFYPAIVCMGVALICLWIGKNDFLVLLAGVLAGFGFGTVASVGQTTAVSLVAKKQYTQATSTFFIFFDTGIGFAPYVSGHFIPSFGYNGVFGLSSLLAFIAIPLYAYVMRNYRKVPENPTRHRAR